MQWSPWNFVSPFQKHTLSQLLAQSREDRKKALKLLTTAQSDNEMLRQDCFQFNERIYEQEKSIQHLTSVKSSLEVHLQNQLNKSAHDKMQMDDSFEEKITKQANNLDFNFNQEPVRLRRMDSGTIFIIILIGVGSIIGIIIFYLLNYSTFFVSSYLLFSGSRLFIFY